MQLQYSPAPVDFCSWVEYLERRYLEVGGARYGSSVESSSTVFSEPFLDSPKGAPQWCDCSDKWWGCVLVRYPYSCFQMVVLLLLRSDKAKYSRPK